MTFRGVSFYVITVEDLVLFKLIAGRHKDDSDVVDLLALSGSLDLDYLKTWAARLEVEPRLLRLAREAARDDLAGH